MAVKKKKLKPRKRKVRKLAAGGVTTGSTITKDPNEGNGGVGQGGQNSGGGTNTNSPSSSGASQSATSKGPAGAPGDNPTSGAAGSAGGISGLSSGTKNAEKAMRDVENDLRDAKPTGIGGVGSIQNGVISGSQPPAGYKAPEVQAASSQVNALRDVMQSQTGSMKSPFTRDMDKTIQSIAGETGVRGLGAGEVANVMMNRDMVNSTPGTAKYDNDLTNKKQWEGYENEAYKAAVPGSSIAKNVANQAIKEIMDGVAAPNATDFRAINQQNGVTTKKVGTDVAGNRFGNYENVSEQEMADIRSAKGIASISTTPSTVPSTENQQVAEGKTDLAEGMGFVSPNKGMPPSNPQISGVKSLPTDDWANVLNSPYNTVFPTKAPVTGTVNDLPGEARPSRALGDYSRYHAGMDVTVEPGTTTYPATPGTVVQVANSSSAYGPTVQVMNTYGQIDRYALHQDQDVPVKVGDSVYQNTPLGVSGPLGPGKYSHLHYENITPKDPAYSEIKQGIMDGSLARNTTGIVGSTSSYNKNNIKSSTSTWAGANGLKSGSTMTAGKSFSSPSNAEKQIAEVEDNLRQSVMSVPSGMPPSAPPTPTVNPMRDVTVPADPRLDYKIGSLPAAAPKPTVNPLNNVTVPADPRLNYGIGSLPAAAPKPTVNPLNDVTVPVDPRLNYGIGSLPAAPVAPAEMQGPVRYGDNLQGIPTPTSMDMLPSEPPPGTVPEGPGAIIGGYQGLKGILSATDEALAKGWKTVSTPNPNFKKAAETYGPAHSMAGKILGADDKWDAAVSDAVKPAVDSLKQSLTRMQENMRAAGIGQSQQDVQRAVETVQKAEGQKAISDRVPTDESMPSSPSSISGTTTVVGPMGGALPGIGYSGFGASLNPASELQVKEALYNEGVIERPEPPPSEKVSVLSAENWQGPFAPKRDFSYPTNPDGTPVQPDQISQRDMDKMRARHEGISSRDVDALNSAGINPDNVMTDDERLAAKVGGFAGEVASPRMADAVLSIIDKLVPGQDISNSLQNPRATIEDYYSRPSWEQEQIKEWANESYSKRAVGSGGPGVGPYGHTSGAPGQATAAGDPHNDATGGKGEKQADWARGINIPSPGDPEYAEYVWWYNSEGGGGWGW